MIYSQTYNPVLFMVALQLRIHY